MSAKVRYFVTNHANYPLFYALQIDILRNDESEPLFLRIANRFLGEWKTDVENYGDICEMKNRL